MPVVVVRDHHGHARAAAGHLGHGRSLMQDGGNHRWQAPLELCPQVTFSPPTGGGVTGPAAAELYCRNEMLSRRPFLDRHALILQEALQFACLEHLAHDIAAADELPLDVKLWDGRPIGI